MRNLMLLLMIGVPATACSWNCTGVPVRSYPMPVIRGGGVSTGAAVASAIAAGILGWELGRHQQQSEKAKPAKSIPADKACEVVNIQDEKRLVCRDARDNWQIQ